MGEKRHIADLYDIWKMGAPTPDSIIRNPKHYNPEIDNSVRRIIPLYWLRTYLTNLAASRGIPLSREEVTIILEGE